MQRSRHKSCSASHALLGRIGKLFFSFFHTLQDELRISVLPTHLSYDSAWPVRKVPLRCTPHFITYHLESKTYAIVTSTSEQTNQVGIFRLLTMVASSTELRVCVPFETVTWFFAERFGNSMATTRNCRRKSGTSVIPGRPRTPSRSSCSRRCLGNRYQGRRCHYWIGSGAQAWNISTSPRKVCTQDNEDTSFAGRPFKYSIYWILCVCVFLH